MKNNGSNPFKQNKWLSALIVLTTVLSLSGISVAESESRNIDSVTRASEEVIVVNVWAPNVTDSGEDLGPALSTDFVLRALKAMTGMKEWQRHLEHTIRNGYPLDEHAILIHRDRAADFLVLASVATSTNADRAALNELGNQYQNLLRWSDEMVGANRKLEMAQFYMSSTALENDPAFQKAAGCADFLAPMLASGHLREAASCH